MGKAQQSGLKVSLEWIGWSANKQQSSFLIFRCISSIAVASVLPNSPQTTPVRTFNLSPTTPFEVCLWINSRFNADENLSTRNFSQTGAKCAETKAPSVDVRRRLVEKP